MWQNTAFMLKLAWTTQKSVIFLCLFAALVSAGKTITELLIAPIILRQIEKMEPISEIVKGIVFFTVLLLLFMGVGAYLGQNIIFGRINIRSRIGRMVSDKMAGTSYPNLLNTHFLQASQKALQACSGNMEPTEYIWTTWTEILTNVMGFFVYLILLSDLHPILAGVSIVISCVGYWINCRINRWKYQHREEENEIRNRMHYLSDITEKREYGKEIRIFGLKNWLDEIWDRTYAVLCTFLIKQEKRLLWIHVAELILTVLQNGVAYTYLILNVLNHKMSAAQFLLYFSVVSGFAQWVTGILDQFVQLYQQSLILTTVREFLEWEESFLLSEGKPLEVDLNGKNEIRLENVSFHYASSDETEKPVMVLEKINLTIQPGEKLAVVGLNGAGKTTLVKIICGFLDPVEGRVLLNGKDIRQYDRREYYGFFSAVFQDFSVLEASVSENVAQRMEGIDEANVWNCIRQAELEETVRMLPHGIETKIGRAVYEDGIELSGGQIQRLMLARALYKDGVIMVLDEPTAALDPIAEHEIYQKYHRMTCGRTSVFISHRLISTRFCDRILFLEKGRIAEEGSHDELMKMGGKYAKLFETQSKYYREGGQAS